MKTIRDSAAGYLTFPAKSTIPWIRLDPAGSTQKPQDAASQLRHGSLCVIPLATKVRGHSRPLSRPRRILLDPARL